MLGSDGEGDGGRRVHADVTYKRRVGNDFPGGGVGVTYRCRV